MKSLKSIIVKILAPVIGLAAILGLASCSKADQFTINESFTNISIDAISSDIVISPSNDGKCTVDYYGSTAMNFQAHVSDGTLKIEETKAKSIFSFLSFVKSNKITVYLPEGEYGSLMINGTTGDVTVAESFTFESADLSLSTGDTAFFATVSGDTKIDATTGDISLKCASVGALGIDLTTGDVSITGSEVSSLNISITSGDVNIVGLSCEGDVNITLTTGEIEMSSVECENIDVTGKTGKIVLDSVVASNNFNVKNGTGNVLFNLCDGANIKISTTTGDIDGNLLSSKIFTTQTTTGDIEVPKTTSGGVCDLSTTTGDIYITID